MRSLAILCALFVLTLSTGVRAEPGQSAWCGEEPCLPEKFDVPRTVNGHTFLPLQTVPFPFVTTHAGSLTGMGIVNLKSIPVVNVGTITTGSKAQLVSFRQSFNLDLKLAHFLGLSLGLGMGNAVGINNSGAFNLGINYAFGAKLGLIVRIAQGKKWYLSLRGDGSVERAEAVLPAALADSAVGENGVVTFNLSSLTRSGRVGVGTGHLMLAYSPHRAIGLTASAGYGSTKVSVGDDSGRRGQLLLGLGSSWRFNSLDAPIVLTLGGSLRLRTDESERVFFPTVGSTGKTGGFVEGGILYSDPKYVDVGIQSTWSVAKNDNRKQVVLVLNHFW